MKTPHRVKNCAEGILFAGEGNGGGLSRLELLIVTPLLLHNVIKASRSLKVTVG